VPFGSLAFLAVTFGILDIASDSTQYSGHFCIFNSTFGFSILFLVPKFDNDNEIHLNKRLHCRFPTRLSDWGLLHFDRIF